MMTTRFCSLIETPRLLLILPNLDIAEKINDAVIDSLADLQPWMGWAQKTPSLDDSINFCITVQNNYKNNDDLILTLIEKSTGLVIGCSGLHHPNWKLREFELDYWGRTGHVGSGLITEGVSAISNYAFDTLHAQRVWIKMNEHNKKSERMAIRLGYSFHSIDKKRVNLAGEPYQTYVYSKNREYI